MRSLTPVSGSYLHITREMLLVAGAPSVRARFGEWSETDLARQVGAARWPDVGECTNGSSRRVEERADPEVRWLRACELRLITLQVMPLV